MIRRAFSTGRALAQNTETKFDIHSFISRIDALYDAEDKKNPTREKPAWQKKPLQTRTTTRPSTNTKNNNNSNQKRPGNKNQGPRTSQSGRRDAGPKQQVQEKLELHVDPAIPPALKRGSSVMNFTRTTKADGKKLADKVFGFRNSSGGNRTGNKMQRKPRFDAKRPNRRDAGRRTRSSTSVSDPANANATLTAKEGLGMVLSLVRNSHNGFIPVSDATSSRLLVSNIPSTAITYETKVWAAIREADKSGIKADDRSSLEEIIRHNVQGEPLKYQFKPELGLSGAVLASGINSNPTFDSAVRTRLGDFASQKQLVGSK